MNIPLSIDGRVLNAQHPGHVVRVEDDRAQSSGFLVYERWEGSNGPNAGGAFDSWVEDAESLDRFFVEAGWSIQWDGQ